VPTRVGWLFEDFQYGKFWDDWVMADFRAVDGDAFAQILPKMLILLIVVVIDFMLQVQGTKKGAVTSSFWLVAPMAAFCWLIATVADSDPSRD
jgi:hypothetical protein